MNIHVLDVEFRRTAQKICGNQVRVPRLYHAMTLIWIAYRTPKTYIVQTRFEIILSKPNKTALTLQSLLL